jgi:cation:H+ antiporter
MIFFIVFLISLYVMYKSSDWVIKHSLNLSRILGMSTLALGFILLSFSTTLPELFVSIFSALEGETNLAVGNILGSNLFDIAVIIGLVSIFAGTIYMKKKETLSLIELLFIASLITIIIYNVPNLSPVHGIVLIVMYGYLVMKLYKGGKVSKEVIEAEEEKDHELMVKIKAFSYFGVSISILLVSAYFLVESSIQIAYFFGVSTTLIGSTLVAFGTSIPELSVEFAAVKKKQYALAMGNLIGSAVTNITLVLGALILVTPVTLDLVPIAGLLPFLMISVLFIWFVFNKKRKLGKEEGYVLLAIYGLFLLEQLGLISIFS